MYLCVSVQDKVPAVDCVQLESDLTSSPFCMHARARTHAHTHTHIHARARAREYVHTQTCTRTYTYATMHRSTIGSARPVKTAAARRYHVCVCVSVRVCVSVCLCVCVRARVRALSFCNCIVIRFLVNIYYPQFPHKCLPPRRQMLHPPALVCRLQTLGFGVHVSVTCCTPLHLCAAFRRWVLVCMCL